MTGGRAPVSVGSEEAASVAQRLFWLGTLVSAFQPLQISASTTDSSVAARSSTGCHRGFFDYFSASRESRAGGEKRSAFQFVAGRIFRPTDNPSSVSLRRGSRGWATDETDHADNRTTPRLFHCFGDRRDEPQMKPTTPAQTETTLGIFRTDHCSTI